MDRFTAMRVFVRIVETGSFTKAADTLYINKTSVTQIIQQLEAQLNVKLLHRTTRKVTVTTDGAIYYERVLQLLADLDDIENSLTNATAVPKGRLRIDVPSPLARMLLIPALNDFYARYPDIQLNMGVSDRIVDLLDENVDCVIRGGEITNQGLVARRLGELKLNVYAAPSYLHKAGIPTHPSELEESSHYTVGFLWSREGKSFPYTMSRGQERLTVRGRHQLIVDDGNAYLAAGLAGLGILWLPEYMATPHLHSGELVTLFTEWQFQSMPLYLAHSPNRHISARLRVFIDWVAELIEQHAPKSSILRS